MARGSHFIWVPLLLSCAFQASDNRNVNTHKGDSNLDILSRLPIDLPEGIDPRNINVTSITIKTCTGLQEQMTFLNKQLKETNIRTRQLDEEAFELRSKVRHLEDQLARCGSSPQADTGCYHNELQNRLQTLLNTVDNDAFLILKVIRLTSEVNKLQTTINLINANSTETTAGAKLLQKELQEKLNELEDKKRLIERSNTNSALIFDIISIQNEIWAFEQEESEGATKDQRNTRIEALHELMVKKIEEMQGKRDASSSMLELIFVHSRIPMIERLINVYLEQSKTELSDYQKQWRQKSELLTQKIIQLGENESDQFITQAILRLQGELDLLKKLRENAQKTTGSKIAELRKLLELQKRQKELLQKHLEGSDAHAQIIIKIISLMKELRETQIDEAAIRNPTTLQGLLKAKESEYAKALTEIKELQRKLQLKTQECSGLEERYHQAKTTFEQKIAQLNQIGDSKAALILNVINLQNEIRTLRDRILVTDSSERISELQRQLEEKQRQLQHMNADIERIIPNPTTILTIIELQNAIWDLQRTTNETTNKRIEGLQTRVDSLISEIGSGDGNTKLMLNILTLQNQVESLRRQLLDQESLHISEVTKLKNDLTAKRKKLQQHINELNERNQTNAKLILESTDLQMQLRNIEEQRRNENTTSSSTINQLKAELRIRKQEHSRDQAEIRTLKDLHETGTRELLSAQTEIRELQKKLQIKGEECSGLEKRYNQTKTEFEDKIEELKRGGKSEAAVIFSIINLHGELRRLTDLIATAKQEKTDKISDLQSELENKQDELISKTAELERLIANPSIILQIIELQNEIWNLQSKDTNGTTRNQIKDLQNTINGLISETDSKGDNNIKLVLQIISLQSQVEHLQGLLSNLKVLKNTELAQLTNNLSTTKKLLENSINELKKNNQTNANLILRITDLTNQLRNLEVEKQGETQTSASTITKLREQLKIKIEEHLEDQTKINALQDKLNQTDVCSGFEQQIKVLQVELDEKMTQLLSKSKTTGSLALQISTLNLQLEELKKQLQNTESKTKITEFQKMIDEKSKELAKKTEELKERSPQAQRLLHIISIQTEIEKYVNVAANDTDYNKITALETRLNQLIEGIRDEENENIKLTFKVLAQRDEIDRLKKLEVAHNKSYSDKIEGLQNELEHIKNQIREKTELLKKSGTRITDLSTQIMDLHKKVKPLEEEISDLKATNAERLQVLQNRLDLTKKQLQDSELLLNEADAQNFQLIMEITDLRSQLKKIVEPKETKKMIEELEEKIQTQQSQIQKLETTNRDLQQEATNLKASCIDNTDCDDVHIQLQQSQEEANRLQQLLQDKNTKLRQLQDELEEQMWITNRLQQEYNNLQKQFQQNQALNNNLQKELSEKDNSLKQLQQDFDGQTTNYQKLQDDYNKLQNEKNELEETVQGLQNRLTDKEDKTIYPRKMTLDPNTAHPRIVLSAGNTEMTTAEQIQNVPDNPGRYDVDLAALGSTGFSSGRQYWEVSVGGKLCYHVGMASESAQRKGTIKYNPLNGYWTIILNKQGQLRAIDKRSTVIRGQTLPLKLGILLDYRNGQISFYDAGARSHIYSFSGQTFTDKIYPFINYCVEEGEIPSPIILVTPGSVDWIK